MNAFQCRSDWCAEGQRTSFTGRQKFAEMMHVSRDLLQRMN